MNNSKKVNEKWSKKDYQKSSKKVYSRSDRAITLIALIVTIIVLLILAGVTINLAVNNQGIFNKARTATRAFKNASENEQTGLDEVDKEIAKYMPNGASEGGSGSESGGGNSGSVTPGSETTLPGSTILRSNAPKISVSGLKYADLDGDGTADGIIVADISKDSTDKTTYKGGNPWGNSDGSFSYTKVTSGLREYSENTNYKYTNADGSTVDGTLIKCKNNTGTPIYYIISLADYDDYGHYWYKNAKDYNDNEYKYGKMSDYSTFTSEDFEKGKENTEKMIDRMKYHTKYNPDYGEPTTGTYADIWNIIEGKVKEGWFVPSKAEWAAFASYSNTSKTSTDSNYYVNYGLSDYCWSSSQGNIGSAWRVYFRGASMGNFLVDDGTGELRLCATF